MIVVTDNGVVDTEDSFVLIKFKDRDEFDKISRAVNGATESILSSGNINMSIAPDDMEYEDICEAVDKAQRVINGTQVT